MSRHYSPKTFLRHVPNRLLKSFFDRKGQLAQINWATHTETEIGLIYDAWQNLPDTVRAEVDRVFYAIDEMACAEGIEALVDEGRFHGEDLASKFNRMESFHEKAMYAYLNHGTIFGVASYFIAADFLSQRYWLRQKSLPRKLPDTSDGAKRVLAEQISEYYRETQGRGHHCTVETYLRGGHSYYFFAYPDDYADMYIGHDEQGQLVKRPQKQAFENIFVYDPETGTLELYVKGDRKVKSRLLYIFCSVILKENPPPDLPREHAYELNRLRSREFAFATDPEDGIEGVRILEMRLAVGSVGRRITLEAAPGGTHQDVYDMMDEYFHPELSVRENMNVTKVRFRIQFAVLGGKKPKSLSFSVSFPDSSNYKSLPEDRRLLVEKYLKRWGIDRG